MGNIQFYHYIKVASKNNLHPYSGHVKNNQPGGAPAHPNGRTERLFIKGPEFPHCTS